MTVDYLWTGNVRLAKVVDTGPVYAAPARDADVVGAAAQRAGVPVECATDGWLRIGVGQFLRAAAARRCEARGDLRTTGAAHRTTPDRLRAP